MIPSEFKYFAPPSVAEAVNLLSEHGYDAKLLAGGQSLIPAMRFRLSVPAVIIDLNGINGISGVREDNGHLAIGAMTREVMLEESSIVQTKYHLLADAARVIADPIVRNMATVGGNIAHADPANDHPAVMLAYNAQVVAVGSGGTRTLNIDDFFVDLFENALDDDEVLTEIRIPRPAAHSGGAYVKMERKVGDYAVSAVAVQLTLDGDTCVAARIGLTNVSPVPMRATDAEQVLIGQRVSEDLYEEAGRAAAAECDPSADLRGSADYKRDITRVLLKRALRTAVQRVN
ncbi:xanthine dehydrogenase family protein subunit M, partial [candidate division KSB1 bacterium]|nr:xanthine dehydrogenase family protein subunit M [candidate division KSB1 bacterium]